LPGGAIDHGETLATALNRECGEELGAAITIGPLLTVVESLPLQAGRLRHLLGVVYRATLNGPPRTEGNDDDIAAVRWWPLNTLRADQLGGVALKALTAAGLLGLTEPVITPDCAICDRNARRDEQPIRERIYNDGLWRVAHAFNSALPGWLVLLPLRHITTLAELNRAEVVALGPLLQQLTASLTAIIGCTKTYVLLLAESQGFAHIHFHIVPRMPDLPTERSGPQVFAYLKQPESDWVPTEEMDRISAALAAALLR
jgi:diadenosine tetraphosphate (Ap4A) HIT family hydrolase